MRTSDDQKKLFVLNVFLGYLKVLGPLVSVVLNSAAHLERISKALMQVICSLVNESNHEASGHYYVWILVVDKVSKMSDPWLCYLVCWIQSILCHAL